MGEKDKYLWPDAFLASENAFLKCLYLVRDELTGQTQSPYSPLMMTGQFITWAPAALPFGLVTWPPIHRFLYCSVIPSEFSFSIVSLLTQGEKRISKKVLN